MKYLSIDLEATGLETHDLIIEFAAVPIDGTARAMNTDLTWHRYIQCPSFEELKPTLNSWVIDNNKALIDKAHSAGLTLDTFRSELEVYLTSPAVRSFFNDQPIVLFGKSLSAIDLPFLHRDLGHEFMRKYFSHRTLDLTCLTYSFIDQGLLPPKAESGSELMKFFKMGDVAHTALEDAENTASLYFKMLGLASSQA